MKPNVHALFHADTWTYTYVVWDEATSDAIVIDPVLDLDTLAWSTSTQALDELEAFIKDKQLNVKLLIDTHAHADHLSGLQDAKRRFNAPIAIGKSITTVQETFKGIFNLEESFATDGSQFDLLVDHEEEVKAGSLTLKGIHTPGHTPACMSYLVGDALFTGDAIFMPDMGTGRCDFPAGSATDLYRSITERIYTLPEATRVFVGHDYGPGGRDMAYETTVGELKEKNIQLKASTSEEDFVKFRTERDATLAPPRLIFPSVQVNVRAGKLPPAESNGRSYLKFPLNLFG
jgi:glyoxylase-like metal-dependent hydrolase (beta-lactamase superfamily II)